MAEVSPVPAASVILLREPLEVLMIRRAGDSSFVPDAWVFPGGATDPEDGVPDELATMRNTASRELREETGLAPASELVWTSRWVTPKGMPKRFDTWFFLARAPESAEVVLNRESVAFVWIAPADALMRNRKGDFPLVFPTIRNLEALAGHDSIDALIESRRGAQIDAVEPVMTVENGRTKIRLP